VISSAKEDVVKMALIATSENVNFFVVMLFSFEYKGGESIKMNNYKFSSLRWNYPVQVRRVFSANIHSTPRD
jgi:hypothetical protein